MSRFQYSLSQYFCCSQHSLAWTWGHSLLYTSHAYILAAGVLVSAMLVPLNFGTVLRNGSAYHTQCMSYQMLGTVSVYVLHNSIYTFLYLTFSSAHWIVDCTLSLSAYPLVHSQSLLCFTFHLAPFSLPSAPLIFEPSIVTVHFLFLKWFLGSVISSLYIPLINSPLSHLSFSLLLTFCCFYM